MWTAAWAILSPFKWYLAVGGVWLLSLGWAYYQGGEYYRETAKAEYTRQVQINKVSLEDANRLISVLQAEAKKDEEELKKLQEAATKDVDAKRTALPRRSVQRIQGSR